MVISPEKRPNQVKTILFLGAGASMIYGYPDSIEFLKGLEKVENDKKWLIDLLIRKGCKTIDDLVRVLRDNIPTESKELGISITTREIEEARGEAQPGPISEEERQRIEKEKNQKESLRGTAEGLLEDIEKEIYRQFSPTSKLRSSKRKEIKEYIKILKSENGDHLPIFTTNYDPVIESLSDEDEDEYKINTLFDEERGEHLRKWIGEKGYSKGSNTINLFKLHGSIYWMYEDGVLTEERVKQTRGISPPEKGQREIIGPGILSNRERLREPYSVYFDYLEEYLAKATNCIVVGFRFDDESLIQIFKRHKHLKIIIVDPKARDIAEKKLKENKKTLPIVPIEGKMEDKEIVNKVRQALEGKLEPSEQKTAVEG